MIFATAPCPGCGAVEEPGICPSCGAEIPTTDEHSEETRARRAAIGPLLEEAEDLVRAFDRIAPGFIPMSIGQFATAVTDGDLYGLTTRLSGSAADLSVLDLNDSATVGGVLRATVVDRLGVTRRLLALSEELGAMAPEAPGEEARDLAIATGRYGAELLATYLRIITSSTVTAARENERRMKALLADLAPVSRMSTLLEEIGELPVDDVNERVGRVLRLPGSYVDELGILSPAAVFGAFADQDEPLVALAERSREYFAHLLPDQFSEPSSTVLLIIPAVTVGVLDRPLVAHRCARLMNRLCEKALEVDRDGVESLVERTSEQAVLIFASAARIDRALRLLTVGEIAGVVDDVAALDSLMKTFLELSEASLRTSGWLALGLQRIVEGAPDAQDDIPPPLAELEQRLAASTSALCRELAQCSNSALRNAASHAQYMWDAAAQDIVDLRTNQRWPVASVDKLVDDLVGALAGTDAGFACFVIGHAIDIPMPSWAEGVGRAFLVELLAQATFGARGCRVDQISADGGDIVLAADAPRDVTNLLPALVGIAAITPTTTRFRVRRLDDVDPLVEVSGQALSRARSAPTHLRDLATLDVMFDAGTSGGADPAQVLHDIAPVLAKVAAVSAMQQLATEAHSSEGFTLISDRLAYSREFIRQRADKTDIYSRRLVDRLERATSASFAVRSGQQPIRRLISALTSLVAWADEQGTEWPPV